MTVGYPDGRIQTRKLLTAESRRCQMMLQDVKAHIGSITGGEVWSGKCQTGIRSTGSKEKEY